MTTNATTPGDPMPTPTRYPVSAADEAKLQEAFTYHSPQGDQPNRYEYLRFCGRDLARTLLQMVPPGRERALAMTKLEEAMMWANKGIASEPPRGFVGVRLVLLLAALGGLLVAGVARGADPEFGACFRDGRVCIAPRVAAPAIEIDLDDGKVEVGVLPGFGYGVETLAYGKLRIGGSALLNVRDTSTGRRLAPSLMLDFMRYVHTGPMLQLGDGGRWFWLVNLGTDLGGGPSGPAAAAKPGA